MSMVSAREACMKKMYESPVLEIVRLTPEETLAGECDSVGLTRVSPEQRTPEARLASRQVQMRRTYTPGAGTDVYSFYRAGSPV